MGVGFDPSSAVRIRYGLLGQMFGTLLQISLKGEVRVAADVSAYEKDVNPGGGPLDSNPYGLLVLPSVRLVTDAGGDSLLSVIPSGLVNTIAARPVRPTDVRSSPCLVTSCGSLLTVNAA